MNWELDFLFYKIEDQMGMLEYLYTNFDKTKIAAMTKAVSEGEKTS